MLGYLKRHPEVSATLLVASSGHHVEAISPEGMFPQWGDSSEIDLIGSGRIEVSDGTEWICYEIPGSASSRLRKYTKGTIRLAKDYTSVILDLKMSSKYWFGDWVNHSGRYRISSVKGSANQAAEPSRTAVTAPAAAGERASGACGSL
jgi:hypothetical protein